MVGTRMPHQRHQADDPRHDHARQVDGAPPSAKVGDVCPHICPHKHHLVEHFGGLHDDGEGGYAIKQKMHEVLILRTFVRIRNGGRYWTRTSDPYRVKVVL